MLNMAEHGKVAKGERDKKIAMIAMTLALLYRERMYSIG
jgi:hypothetical protein